MKHRYLFILEIAAVEVGKTYDELPSHLTLMSRFFSDLTPDDLSVAVGTLFKKAKPIALLFGATTKLGPQEKQQTVHLVEHSAELRQLHEGLRSLLDLASVDYEYPQFIGKGHKPHVTERQGVWFDAGSQQTARTVCLIQVVDRRRIVRSKCNLSG